MHDSIRPALGALLCAAFLGAEIGAQVQNTTTGLTYATISAAVAAANPNDTLIILNPTPQVYTENVVIDGSKDPLTIMTQTNQYPPNVTVTSPAGGSVFTFKPGPSGEPVTNATLVQGIEIVGGTGQMVPPTFGRLVGGGVACLDGSAPVIRNCIIKNNTADDGAGVFIGQTASSEGARLMRSTIRDNAATNDGGGVYVELTSGDLAGAPQFSRSRISQNTAGGSGGGFFANVGTSPEMSHCWFVANLASLDGGGVCFLGTVDARIENSMLENNDCGFAGGGLAIIDGIGTDVERTTVASNEAGTDGGGIYDNAWDPQSFGPTRLVDVLVARNVAVSRGGGLFTEGLDAHVESCTVADNTANVGGGIAHRGVTVDHSILWGDSPSELHAVSGSATVSNSDVQGGAAGTNNINVSPQFTPGTAGKCPHASLDDYHLTQTSNACVNFGPGSVPSYLANRSTHPNHTVVDTGLVDLGFHYPGPGCP